MDPMQAANLINLLILSTWLGFLVIAFVRLARTPMGELARVLWAALILLIPLLGALAFMLVSSAHRPPTPLADS